MAYVRRPSSYGSKGIGCDPRSRATVRHSIGRSSLIAVSFRERDQQLLAEGDQLRTEIEGLRRALEDAEQRRREGIGRLEAELAAVAEQRRQLQERHETAEQSGKELRERYQELHADLDRLRSAPAPSESNDELEATRAELENLKRKLDASDRLEREMAGILEGMGIRIREI